MIAWLLALWAMLFAGLPGLDASVIIEIPGQGHGSGTFISATQLVTAKHVMEHQDPAMRVRGSDGTIYRIVSVADGPADISVVTVDHAYTGPIPGISCKPPYRGQWLYYYGSPGEIEFAGPLFLSVMLGKVTDTQDFPMVAVVLTNGESEPGVSGSGVMDVDGNVVGVYDMAWGHTTFGGFVGLSAPDICNWLTKQLAPETSITKRQQDAGADPAASINGGV